jgi:DNA-binding protein H-NS
MPRTSIAAQIAALKKQQLALEKKQAAMQDKTQSKALARIKEIAKKAGLTAKDIATALGSTRGRKPAVAKKTTRSSKLAGKKVAPKYRNPADASQTWTGRGKAPTWAAALKTAGTLDSALIK